MPSGLPPAAAAAGRSGATTVGTSTLEMTRPSRVRMRILGVSIGPRRAVSTMSASGMWMATRSRSWISTSTSNVGGALRSSTDFWVPRRRASSSESVTLWMPPRRSFSVGLTSRFSIVWPCAVAISCTPRSAMARALAQHRGLADAGPPQQQDALAADHDVADDLAGAGHGSPDAHREAGDAARPVANRGHAVEGALDAGAVVVAELADVVGDVFEVRCRNRAVREQHLAPRHACFRLPAEVEHDLEQLAGICALVQRARQVGGQRARQELDLLVPGVCALPAPGGGYKRRFGPAHASEGTSPFSRTGTRTASSLTRSSCVKSTLNPRPRRASIMCES